MESDKSRSDRTNRRGLLLVAALLLALVGLVFAQAIAADDGPKPTPSPYTDRVQTTEELDSQDASIERYIAGHAITGAQLLGPDLSTSTKTADRSEAPVGGTIMYTIVVNNTGDADVPLTMTDTLPAGVTYVSHDMLPPTNGLQTGGGYAAGVLVWEGVLGAGGSVEIALQVRVDSGTAPGTVVTNTAVISGGEQTVSPAAAVTVSEATLSPNVALPFIIYGETPNPPTLTLSATRPNSNNQWTVSWTPAFEAGTYELEASQNPSFSSPDRFEMGSAKSRAFNPPASTNNLFYFRARSRIGALVGPWSNTVRVVGAYYDEFENADSGWEVRRTTNIDEVQSFYEIDPGQDKSWLILRVEDSWDWGIASPLLPAPELPYVIEYEAKPANLGNLVSLGAVFGGDKPGATCPDKSSTAGWYEHTLCFNHFYNTNTIWFGKLKMLFERVDRLVWCPNCGGSPMKRLGDIDPDNARELSGVDNDGWNRYRIEVRANGIKVLVGKRGGSLNEVITYNDTRWVNDPYFGVFASTDEYSNSTARFEFFSVTPLDN